MARARVFSLARSFARPRAAPRFAVDRAIDDVDHDVVETRVTPPLDGVRVDSQTVTLGVRVHTPTPTRPARPAR